MRTLEIGEYHFPLTVEIVTATSHVLATTHRSTAAIVEVVTKREKN